MDDSNATTPSPTHEPPSPLFVTGCMVGAYGLALALVSFAGWYNARRRANASV